MTPIFVLALLAPRFIDVTAELGLTLGNDEACWLDVDRDGWPDLVAGGTVWKNEAGKHFRRLQDGLGQVVGADFDNDGYPDLYSWSQVRLYRNERGRAFTPVPLPELPHTVSLGAAWGDFDNDGWVDLYIGGYEDWDKGITYPSFILRNLRGKAFESLWSAADRRSRGVTACDFDRDGDLDVYVSNYRLQPNELWLNNGKGEFSDVAKDRNALATSEGFPGGHSIGAAWGDFDNDGEFDLFAGNFAHVDSRGDQPKSRFLRNLGASGGFRFSDKGPLGITYQESYASPAAGDIDNDGSLDLYFTTVYATASFGRPNHPVLYRNLGDWKISDETTSMGLADLPATYQAALADFRNDGRLAICTAGRLYANTGPSDHWLDVQLEGDGRTVNRSAVGAQVRIKLGERVITRQVEAGTGQGNQNDLRMHFGLGDHSGKVDLEITWPGGRRQRARRVTVDRTITIRYRA